MLKTIMSSIAKDLLKLENSEILQTINHATNIANQKLDELNAKYETNPVSLNDFLMELSPIIDAKIIAHAQVNQLIPVGGGIALSKNLSDDNVLVAWEFYFSNNEKKLQKIHSEKIFDKEIFESESYQKIINRLSFDIDVPNI